jgi:hypothetical protein
MAATTTTAVNACDCVIELENAASAMVDISGSSNKVSLQFGKNFGEFKPFGSAYPVRLTCGKDMDGNLDIVWTTAVQEGRDIAEQWFFETDDVRTLRVSVPDNSVGSIQYSGPVICESYPLDLESNNADPVMISLPVKAAGEWTRTVIT